jgi:hypothetical protein
VLQVFGGEVSEAARHERSKVPAYLARAAWTWRQACFPNARTSPEDGVRSASWFASPTAPDLRADLDDYHSAFALASSPLGDATSVAHFLEFVLHRVRTDGHGDLSDAARRTVELVFEERASVLTSQTETSSGMMQHDDGDPLMGPSTSGGPPWSPTSGGTQRDDDVASVGEAAHGATRAGHALPTCIITKEAGVAEVVPTEGTPLQQTMAELRAEVKSLRSEVASMREARSTSASVGGCAQGRDSEQRGERHAGCAGCAGVTGCHAACHAGCHAGGHAGAHTGCHTGCQNGCHTGCRSSRGSSPRRSAGSSHSIPGPSCSSSSRSHRTHPSAHDRITEDPNEGTKAEMEAMRDGLRAHAEEAAAAAEVTIRVAREKHAARMLRESNVTSAVVRAEEDLGADRNAADESARLLCRDPCRDHDDEVLDVSGQAGAGGRGAWSAPAQAGAMPVEADRMPAEAFKQRRRR